MKPKDSFDAALARAHECAGTRTQVELAAFLSIRQSSVSDARGRGSEIPDSWLITFALHGFNPRYIAEGVEHPKYLVVSGEESRASFGASVAASFEDGRRAGAADAMQAATIDEHLECIRRKLPPGGTATVSYTKEVRA